MSTQTAANNKTLVIVPDGKALWLNPETKETSWRQEQITELLEQLPAGTSHVLIGVSALGAETLTSQSLGYSCAWCTLWLASRHTVTHRFPLENRFSKFGDANAKHEIWFLTQPSSSTISAVSAAWADAFMRLGFDISSWKATESLSDNLQARRLKHNLRQPSPFTQIVVMDFDGAALHYQQSFNLDT